jgi:peptidyl-prolyl cis-trans isomerase SurA
MRKDVDARGFNFIAKLSLKACLIAALTAGGAILAADQGQAQTILSSINGDPITDIDVNERMKMLRILRKPATREAAIESLYADRLKVRESAKFGVRPKDSDISPEVVQVAQDLKITPEAMIGALQQAGVSPEHFKAHFRAEYAFNVLVQALNKGVEASEKDVRAELAKQGGKAAAGAAYTVRQIIFTVPNAATPAILTTRANEAEQLRARFTDCETGLPLAWAINDVTVRDPLTRTSLELNEGLRELLDKTPVGHLTPVARSSSGFEVIALCKKEVSTDDTALRTAISQKLLAAHIATDAARRLKTLRSRAVITQH